MKRMPQTIVLLCLLALTLNACQTKEATQPSKTTTKTAQTMISATPAASPRLNQGDSKTGGELKTTPSGLKYQDLVVGAGSRPFFGQKVKLRYTGWTEDGIKFDSNQEGAKPPLEITLNKGE